MTLTELPSRSLYYIKGELADGTESRFSVWAPTPSITEVQATVTNTSITVPHLTCYRYSLNGTDFTGVVTGNKQYFSGSQGPYIKYTENTQSYAIIEGLSPETEYTLTIVANYNNEVASNAGTYTFTTESASARKPAVPASGEVTDTTVSFV